jgi:methyltransferase family protein
VEPQRPLPRCAARRPPPGCGRALDIGCGHGEFARLLAHRAARVEGIDRAAEMVARARNLTPMFPALHHMPFAPALEKAKGALRPGGVLAVVGLYRVRTPVDLAVSALAAPVNRFHLLAHGRANYAPPVVPASMTLPEIRTGIREVLPGPRIRRHLLWRYSVLWQRP